ncbi:MAG TPA: SH3 domain-containing protein [Burkholderiales bacterium]|nr:SH3 domain-containing protein [Burkholderiales bacterium]
MRRAVAGLLFALVAQSVHVAVAAEFRTVAEEAAVLYDAPSVQSKKLFIVGQGYPLEIIVVLQGWVKVRDASGALSWVEAGKVSAKQRMVLVKTPVAQIRQAADENSPVVFQAQQNVVMELTEVTGSWLHVRHRDGASGYIRITQVWGV